MNRISIRGVIARLAFAGAMVLGAAQAYAGPLISVEISGDGQYDQYFVESEGVDNGDGTFTLTGIGYGENFSCDWEVTVNPDPTITGTFNLTNLSALPQNFALTVTLPVPLGLPAPTVMGGFVGSALNGTQYFDQNLDSDVTLQDVAGTPIYQARIGATTVQSLLLGTFNAFGGPGVFGNINQLVWGAPIPSAPGPAIPVAGNMNIRTTFNLSAGDRVAIPVNFVVEPVPEPGTLVLLGLSIAAIAGLRSRRS